MTNIIERTLETIAFALLIAGALAFWFVTPAHACTGSSLYTCDENGNVQNRYAIDHGTYGHYESDDQGNSHVVHCHYDDNSQQEVCY